MRRKKPNRKLRRIVFKSVLSVAVIALFILVLLCICGWNRPETGSDLPLQTMLMGALVAAITIVCIIADEKEDKPRRVKKWKKLKKLEH